MSGEVERSSRAAVEVTLLGGFEVRVDGCAVPDDAWRRRQAAALVKVLALAHGATLHREQVIDALWPDLAVDEAAPRLHKAAHYARRALGPGSLVLRGEVVSLLEDDQPAVDLHAFVDAAEGALRDGTSEAAARALERWTGPVLPTDPYESWAESARDRADHLHQRLLRQAGRWEDLVALDATDEEAHLALMRSLAGDGDIRAALRQFERLDRALTRELGVGPGAAAVALRDELLARGPAPVPARPEGSEIVGRDRELRVLGEALAAAADRGGRAVFVSGPAGIGKSALLQAAADRATASGWRVGRGGASAIEGAWPYAPVLEALSDLCRTHPALLDGVDDLGRAELERAMSGHVLEWSDDAHHSRLFLAAGELTRLAAGRTGALLVLDDLHDADDASLRLLHHLVRSAATSPLVVFAAHRDALRGRPDPGPDRLEEVRASLLGRGAATELAVGPLDRASTDQLVRTTADVDERALDSIWSLSAGVPWAVLDAARVGGTDPLELSPELRAVLQRVAVTGLTFDTDCFVALSGLEDADAFAHLDAALASGVVRPDTSGYRFRHALLRDALLAGVPEHARRQIHCDAALRLESIGASPAQVAHHLVAAGDREGAVPHLLRAAETAAALGAYRDALDLLDQCGELTTGPHRPTLLALRARVLAVLGDPRAIQAYREAAEATWGESRRALLAGMARAAITTGDLDTARAALDGLDLDGGPSDIPILLGRAYVAYLSGDLDGTLVETGLAQGRIVHSDVGWHMFDLVGLQAMVAHHRGEWNERLRFDIQRSKTEPTIACLLFDGHLCVAEYLLYGPTPYTEVIELALDLKRTAVQSGAARAEAFATTLAGEAALLSGDLDRAETLLQEAVDLHREIGATSGEGHSTQRLAEVLLARGDRDRAELLLQRSLRLARWSPLARHLVQRAYGALISAAPDPVTARAMVDRAVAETGFDDQCMFCQVVLDIPAAIACAEVGDVEAARRFLAEAEQSAANWSGTAWDAAVLEAKAHVVAAEGDRLEAGVLLEQAATTYADTGQPLDAARCRSIVLVDAAV